MAEALKTNGSLTTLDLYGEHGGGHAGGGWEIVGAGVGGRREGRGLSREEGGRWRVDACEGRAGEGWGERERWGQQQVWG